MDWTVTYADPAELRRSFGDYPEARYRPVTAWWWSGEPVTEERLLWQLDRIAELGCGGFDITGLAMHGPAAGTVADEPAGLSPEWYRLYRLACERARELGLGVARGARSRLARRLISRRCSSHIRSSAARKW